MAKDRIFIEPRDGGGFGAKHEDGKRSVVTADTQKAVIEQTKIKYPDAEVHVARVRDVGPGPDKYRKVYPREAWPSAREDGTQERWRRREISGRA